MLFRVSSLVGVVLLPVLLERGMFFEQFWYKTVILFKHIFMQNSNQSTICTLINLLSWITVKRVYMAYLGQKIISNFLTKPVCYHEFNAFEELNKSRSWHANCLLLDIDYSYTSCMSTLDDMMSIRS